MAGREKAKKKALHRGLDDIINRDASLTSRLLGRVQPASREPLTTPAVETLTLGGGPEDLADLNSPESSHERTKATLRPGVKEPLRVIPDSGLRSQWAANADGQKSPVNASTQGTEVIPLEDFIARWEVVLRSGSRAGKLRICEVLYEKTYAAGVETFFTSYDKLAKLTGIEKKQCAINIKQLESLGFIERINIFNTATRQGTEFKLHLNPLSPGQRRTPRYHCYDEDLL